MHLSPNMYKMITLKANAKEIVTWKCFWCQICTKSSLCRVIHGFFPSCDICICKCSPWEFSDKCESSSILLFFSAFDSAAIVVHWRYIIAVEKITDDRQVRNLFNYVCHYTRSYIEICMPVDDFWVANM